MTKQPTYGTTAKALHWLTVSLLMVQYPLGWFMPEIHHGMKPGGALTFHISFGITILALMTFRFVWRITHPVAPASSLPAWQKFISEAVHWLLYGLVFATTMSGWLFASHRGWSISLFYTIPLPMLTPEAELFGSSIGRWHGTMELALLLLIGSHVAAALAHTFIFRDRIMQRMLPEKRTMVGRKYLKPGIVAMKPAGESRLSA
ncbi:MAG TPA: cytochrome b [Bradyrhizobium sp.]|nr:cytochrome b [Bradyrhizobium sp.]